MNGGSVKSFRWTVLLVGLVLVGCAGNTTTPTFAPTTTLSAEMQTTIAAGPGPAATADTRTPVMMTTVPFEPSTPLPAKNIAVKPGYEGDTSFLVSMIEGYTLILTTPENEEIRIREEGLVGWVGGEMSRIRYTVAYNGQTQQYDLASGEVAGVVIVSKGYVILGRPGFQIRYEKID